MMTKRDLLSVAVVTLLLGWAFAAPAGAVYDPGKIQAQGVYVELAQAPVQVTGGWEYIIDLYTNGGGSQRYGIWGPETFYENMANLDEDVSWMWGTQDLVMQFWDKTAAAGSRDSDFKHPSMDTNGDDVWELTNYPWSMLNTWHAPSEYATGYEVNHTTLREGKEVGDYWMDGSRPLGQDLVQVYNTSWGWGHDPGLWFTLRIVSSEILPSLEWSVPGYGTGVTWSESVWLDHPDYVPGVGVDFDHDGITDVVHENYGLYPILGDFDVAGDFNKDGFIDGDDIDLMADYIRTGVAPTAANYDLSADGTSSGTDGSVTILDLDYLVRFMVPTSAVDADGYRIFGTEYGDFNLDGEIELGDLTRLGTYYGVGSTWAQGNANRWLDLDIELGDLTILGTYYGASNGGVDAIPEPMTMSLLAVGAVAMLRRRKS